MVCTFNGSRLYRFANCVSAIASIGRFFNINYLCYGNYFLNFTNAERCELGWFNIFSEMFSGSEVQEHGL